MSMSLCRDIQGAIELDSKWAPKIFVDIPPPVAIKNASSVTVEPETGLKSLSCDSKPSSIETKVFTDIVPYLSKPDTLQECQLLSLNYPTGCVYRFDRFKGQSNKDALCKYYVNKLLFLVPPHLF